MKICERGLNFVQIIDAHGECRICGWNRDNLIGSVLDDSLYDVYHSEKAEKIRQQLIDGDYTNCPMDNCPYLANGSMEEHLVDIDEIPDYPRELYLAYEGKCNYKCTCCTSHGNMAEGRERDWEENYRKIKEQILPVLPYVKRISAHGRGELFASPHILEVLSEWKPVSPKEELSVSLETNGSLFNEKNWNKISNLGQYNLYVSITIMSFQEEVYQYLSGTKLPISNLVNNLKFIKSLRESGVINTLELATVMQEQNFREMPEFTRRCIEEFGADIVRIRPIMPGGPLPQSMQWFMDVRNPKHPYYQEYKRVMKNPIFEHEKVLLWSSDLDSTIGVYLGEKEKCVLNYIDKILSCDDLTKNIKTILSQHNCEVISLYGMGRVGKLILRLCDAELVREIYDNQLSGSCFCGRNVQKHSCETAGNDTDLSKELLLITVADGAEKIKDRLQRECSYGCVMTMDEWN
jgi:sulfatase maturation enzyme AslB (radical SAM superfamily)